MIPETNKKSVHSFIFVDIRDAQFLLSDLTIRQVRESHFYFLNAVEVVLNLAQEGFSESVPTENDLQKSQQQEDLSDRPFLQNLQQVPSMSKSQLNQGMLVALMEYWRLSCWTCHDPGHSTFTSPYFEQK